MADQSDRQKGSWLWRLRVTGTILSILLLIWLLWRQDWDEIFSAVKTLSLWILLVTVLLLLVRHIWNTVRWCILLRAQGISIRFSRAINLVFTGLFASNFLPGMVGGDVVRIAGILQESDKRVAGAASVVVDRIVGMVGMFFILPFSAPLISMLFSEGFIVVGVSGLSSSKVPKLIQESLRKVFALLRIWLRQPGWLLVAMFASLVGMLSYMYGVLILAKGLGIPVTYVDVVGATTLTYFITIVPLSINGYGIRELAILSFYTHFGASTEQATVLALITRFLFLLVSLPGAFGVGSVLQSNRSPSHQIEEEIE
jgi:uncharacterized membrane protein YbhN (UPF0104 family)